MITVNALHKPLAPQTRQMRAMLVVDDDASRRAPLAGMLESLGAGEILQADSIMAALAILASKRVDVVLCAPRVSGHDAFDVVGLLSASERPPLLGFVCESDEGMAESGAHFAESLGMTVAPVLTRPFSPDALRDWLSALPTRLHRRVWSAAVNDTDKLRDSQVYAAFEGNQFCAHFQPQVDVVTQALTGFEILARWHPAPDVIRGPAYFYDALIRLGAERQLIARLLEDVAWLHRRLLLPIHMSLNVSAASLIELDFVPFLRDVITAQGMVPAQFVIEVTEQESLSDEALWLLAAAGHRLRLLGFGLSVDDFGTGYASLERVDMLPLTEIKVDRRFIAGSERRLQTRTLLESCITLAKRLGIKSVVEGVETDDDYEIARAIGAGVVQGYLFAPPLSAAAAVTWVWNHQHEAA